MAILSTNELLNFKEVCDSTSTLHSYHLKQNIQKT